MKITLPKLHKGQKKLFAERKRFNVVRCGRRWGKTVFAVFLIVYGLFVMKVPVAYSAPSYKMMMEVWRIVLALLSPAIVKTDAQNKRIIVLGNLPLDFWSLDAPEKVRGQKYGLFIVDEAALIETLVDIFQKVIRPTLTDLKGHAWFLSTPVADSDFQKLDELSKQYENWLSYHAPTSNNPHIDPEELREIIEQLPADVVAQEYNAEYVNFNGKNFVQYFDENANVTAKNHFDPYETVYISFDFNIANTAYAIQKTQTSLHVLREYTGELVDLQGMCNQIQLDYPGSVFVILGDASGNSGSALSDNNKSAYELIRGYLDLGSSWKQFNVPKTNPSHRYSYIHCNAFFKNYTWTVHESCTKLINDIKKVKVIYEKGKFQIDKSNEELTHYLDAGLRYPINAEFRHILKDVNMKED